MAENQYRFGVEGYQDKYTEDSVELVEHGRFVGFTAEYIHSSNGFFSAVQTRVAYGKDDYKSVSGTIKGIPQYEGEVRLLTGMRVPIRDIGGVKALLPYIGIGTRYFYDNSKGQVTNTGFFGYDRRILQVYLPVGVNWEFTHGNITFWPNVEVDPMIYGRVNSRLSNFNRSVPVNEAEFDILNQQRSGLGARGELMVGQKLENFSWQVGPYVRYWDVDDSDLQYDPGGATPGFLLEPANERLQAGAALKVMF